MFEYLSFSIPFTIKKPSSYSNVIISFHSWTTVLSMVQISSGKYRRSRVGNLKRDPKYKLTLYLTLEQGTWQCCTSTKRTNSRHWRYCAYTHRCTERYIHYCWNSSLQQKQEAMGRGCTRMEPITVATTSPKWIVGSTDPRGIFKFVRWPRLDNIVYEYDTFIGWRSSEAEEHACMYQ